MAGRQHYRDSPWLTDCSVSREREVEVDLEIGGTMNEEDGTNSFVSTNGQTKQLLNRVWNGPLSFDGSASSSRFCEVADDSVELLIDKNSEGEEGQQNMTFVDKKHVEEKRKKKNSKKPPRPPRPSKGPSPDAADQRLMQEIAELAMRKRARIERIKALKKMRAAKASSWSSSLSAMIITILFLLIIIFQGILAFGILIDWCHFLIIVVSCDTKNCVSYHVMCDKISFHPYKFAYYLGC